jgi:hypothetical protein
MEREEKIPRDISKIILSHFIKEQPKRYERIFSQSKYYRNIGHEIEKETIIKRIQHKADTIYDILSILYLKDTTLRKEIEFLYETIVRRFIVTNYQIESRVGKLNDHIVKSIIDDDFSALNTNELNTVDKIVDILEDNEPNFVKQVLEMISMKNLSLIDKRLT